MPYDTIDKDTIRQIRRDTTIKTNMQPDETYLAKVRGDLTQREKAEHPTFNEAMQKLAGKFIEVRVEENSLIGSGFRWLGSWLTHYKFIG